MRIVKLHDIKYNPLRNLFDATWFFSWSAKHSCCLILPYTEIGQDDIRVQRPNSYAWLKLPLALEHMTTQAAKGELKHLDLEEPLMDVLLQIGSLEQKESLSKPTG